MSTTVKEATILGFGVFCVDPEVGATWLRTGSRVVHGIKTYPTLKEALSAILLDPFFPDRIGHYQLVAEYAFFCRNGEECRECLSHKPVPLESIDWSIVQSRVRI